MTCCDAVEDVGKWRFCQNVTVQQEAPLSVLLRCPHTTAAAWCVVCAAFQGALASAIDSLSWWLDGRDVRKLSEVQLLAKLGLLNAAVEGQLEASKKGSKGPCNDGEVRKLWSRRCSNLAVLGHARNLTQHVAHGKDYR